MKHKSKIAAIVILSIIVLGAALFFLWEHLTDYSTALEINWGISLPSQASLSEVYAKTSGSSFHGDGIRYHVFTYQDAASVASILFIRPPFRLRGPRRIDAAPVLPRK